MGLIHNFLAKWVEKCVVYCCSHVQGGSQGIMLTENPLILLNADARL